MQGGTLLAAARRADVFENTMLEMVAAERESGSSHGTDTVSEIMKYANMYNRALDKHSVAVEMDGESFDVDSSKRRRGSTRRRRRYSKPKVRRNKTTRKKKKKKKKKSKKKRKRR